jgi:DNA-binding transcriptional LysR family regulator
LTSSRKRILEDVNEAERAASGEYSAPRGELIVTAPIVFGRLHVLPVTTEFLATYPEVAVRLVLGDRVVNLLEDQVDLAVRIGDCPTAV